MLDLVGSGRTVADVAPDLKISGPTIYAWRHQDRIDKGLEPGLTSAEKAELATVRRRIVGPPTELAIRRRASDLLSQVVPPQGGSKPSQ